MRTKLLALAVGLLGTALVVTNVGWFFTVIDQGVSLTHTRDQANLDRIARDASIVIANECLRGADMPAVVARLRADPEIRDWVQIEENRVVVTEVEVEFADGKCARVEAWQDAVARRGE